MEIHLIIVIVLFIFAISDLMVGVSNDAVNFLNSAIGSKVAPRHIIMIVASLGILAGVTFSSGLMEVARKGIFNPQFFYLNEIMVIFLAVMITDVILLDFYNTFALPTSTTVSIVFELLGAAVAVALLKISNNDESLADLTKYINTTKAFVIISGILLSVVVAFTVGAIIQFFTRLLFTFDYTKKIKRYGSFWGGLALSTITFFILIKGAKGSSILSAEDQLFIKEHTNLILTYSFIGWTIVLQLLQWFTKINILKPIVLIGTFALALAFAANDLVNFIGVPLAGLSAYKEAIKVSDPSQLLMTALAKKVSTPTVLLLLSGGIMVVTLWINKKSRSVTETEVNLGRQTEGYERFESTLLSRKIVGMSISFGNIYKKLTPNFIQSSISNRFVAISNENNSVDSGAFDLVRASVNLMVASMLISFATSLKLPLSTTYVTFMVAMGSSFADKAWGRESAVYRVTGVITVIGGWFLTAIIAFTVSVVFATIIFFGKLLAIIVLALLAAYFIYKTHILHKERSAEIEEIESESIEGKDSPIQALQKLMIKLSTFIGVGSEIYSNTISGFTHGNNDQLKENYKKLKILKKSSNRLVAELMNSTQNFPQGNKKIGRRFGKMIANIQELYFRFKNISEKCLEHLENNHSLPIGEQLKEFNSMRELIFTRIEETKEILTSGNFENYEHYFEGQEEFNELISTFDENQLARIINKVDTTNNSMLFLEVLSESENILIHLNSLISLLKKNYDKYSKLEAEPEILIGQR